MTFNPFAVRQFADICLFSTAQYKCTVAELENELVNIEYHLLTLNSFISF